MITYKNELPLDYHASRIDFMASHMGGYDNLNAFPTSRLIPNGETYFETVCFIEEPNSPTSLHYVFGSHAECPGNGVWKG